MMFVGLPGLVNLQKTMENHHFQWENPLVQWSFSIAMLNYQRVSKDTAFTTNI
jgi:hypothetical protein